MKKRIALLIAVLAVAAIAVASFAGCSSTPTQRLLLDSRPWENMDVEEYFVYDVEYAPKETDAVKGTYTVAIKGYDHGEKLSLDGFSYEEPCYHIRSELDLENGDYVYTDSVVTPDIKPVYGAEEKLDHGTRTSYTARYADEKCTFSYTENTQTYEGSIDVGEFDSSAYIDNTFLYQLVRCLPDVASGLSFSVPNFIQGSKESVTVSLASGVVQEPFEGGTVAEGSDTPTIACTAAVVKLNRTFPGSGISLMCSVANDDYALENGTKIAHMIVKIVEGSTTYTLKTVSDVIPA